MGQAQTGRRQWKCINTLTLDLPDEMSRNLTTPQRTKDTTTSPNIFSYCPPVLDPGGCKYIEKKEEKQEKKEIIKHEKESVQKIKKTDDVDIEKLKTFKMPKKAPNFQGKKTES